MNPETQRLESSPRDLAQDAFFTVDRSTTAVLRTVPQANLQLNSKGGVKFGMNHEELADPATPVVFSGFMGRHKDFHLTENNQLPHGKLRDSSGKIDESANGWTHKVEYRGFFSAAARSLPGSAKESIPQKRLRVSILFGTGSEGYRHGVFGATENAADPTLLIIVKGVEPNYEFEFTNPKNPSEKKTLRASDRWGCSINAKVIERCISAQYSRLIDYDITVLAAFSTGYLGLQGVIDNRLLPLDKLERVVIFDCLYGTLRPALDRVLAVKGSTKIICYVATGGGNSFRDNKNPKFSELSLGGNPRWKYIDLLNSTSYHVATSARLVSEAISAGGKIIDTLPSGYATAHANVISGLPPRLTLVSDANVFRSVKGSLPAGAVSLQSYAAKESATITAFIGLVSTTRHCITRAWLLGWAAPAGEERHDMLLVEFAWEYLA